MTFEQYHLLFDTILNDAQPKHPYDDAHFLEYTKLNKSRTNRWLKIGKLTELSIERLKAIETPQHWIVISEPWCGDSAHIMPFLHMMSLVNPMIHLDIQLRDVDSEIDQYLTNDSKSIPKLIIRDDKGNDLQVWGPRPKAAQALFLSLKANEVSADETKVAMQQWFNEDHGAQIQDEIISMITTRSPEPL